MSIASAPEREPRPALTATDIALGGVVLVWGFGYVTFKVGQLEIPTGLFNLLRYIIATPVFWLVLFRSGEDWRLPRKDWPRMVVTGLIGVFLYSMVFASAAKLSTAANTSLLLALSPVWGVLVQWAMGRGVPAPRFAVGSAVAFTGAAMVIGMGGTRLGFGVDTFLGDALALAGSFIWAWYGIVAQPLLRSHSGTKVQAWINLVALVAFLLYQGPASLRFDWAGVSATAWASLVYVAVMVTVFGHIVWYTAIARVGPNRPMLAMYLIPVLATAFGAVFLGQAFSLPQVAGAVVALGGVALVRRT